MQPKPEFEKVVASSGHMIDKPDRPKPRFPPEKETVVREAYSSSSSGLADRRKRLRYIGRRARRRHTVCRMLPSARRSRPIAHSAS